MAMMEQDLQRNIAATFVILYRHVSFQLLVDFFCTNTPKKVCSHQWKSVSCLFRINFQPVVQTSNFSRAVKTKHRQHSLYTVGLAESRVFKMQVTKSWRKSVHSFHQAFNPTQFDVKGWHNRIVSAQEGASSLKLLHFVCLRVHSFRKLRNSLCSSVPFTLEISILYITHAVL